MNFFFSAFPFLFLFLAGFCDFDLASAETNLDQLIGIRLSQFASQKVLSNAPLPSLEPDRKFRLIPAISYMDSKVGSSGGYASSTYSGSFHGWTLGLGFTTQSESSLSWYGFGMHTNLRGSIVVPSSVSTGNYTFSLNNMQSSGYNLAAGANLRLWSAQGFPFTIGLIAGSFVSQFESSFDTSGTNPNAKDGKYSSSSSVYGPLAGIQAFTQVLGLKINPYFLYFYDISDPCQEYSTTSSTDTGANPSINDQCTAANPYSITLNGTFSTYGLNIGVLGLSLGVYSNVKKDSSLNSITLNNYALSYGFAF